ncbi:MAG: DCC1-like thiol-disulfide oxidoreductase family protein [Gemmatimonadaceae bacterium]
MTGAASVLLYDGLCGLCDRTIQFVVKHDRNRTLQFAALQGEYAIKLFEQVPDLRRVDSLIFVQLAANGSVQHVLVRSNAVIAIARYLGGLWRVAEMLLRLIPQPLRDCGYDAIARRRFCIIGRLDACRIPPIEDRARFLD